MPKCLRMFHFCLIQRCIRFPEARFHRNRSSTVLLTDFLFWCNSFISLINIVIGYDCQNHRNKKRNKYRKNTIHCLNAYNGNVSCGSKIAVQKDAGQTKKEFADENSITVERLDRISGFTFFQRCLNCAVRRTHRKRRHVKHDDYCRHN